MVCVEHRQSQLYTLICAHKTQLKLLGDYVDSQKCIHTNELSGPILLYSDWFR